jgi:molybdopterin converting factor small subunit
MAAPHARYRTTRSNVTDVHRFPTLRRTPMATEVRIPTILRNLTNDAKAVEGKGATLKELIDDLDARYPGIGARLVEDGKLRRFINVYLNDEDVRFVGGLDAPVADGDTVTVLPAVAGGMR